MIQAGLAPTQRQVEVTQQNVVGNRQGIQANKQQIATNEQETNDRFASVRHSDAKLPVTIKVINSDDANIYSLPGGFTTSRAK